MSNIVKPSYTVHHHEPGNPHLDAGAGDLLLTSGNAFLSRAIQFGQTVDMVLPKLFSGDPHVSLAQARELARTNHAALIVGKDAGGVPILAEALSGGVVETSLARYDGTDYELVRIRTHPHDREQIVAFARSVIEAKGGYSYVGIAGIIASIILRLPFRIGFGTNLFCSQFVVEARCRAADVYPKSPAAMWPYHVRQFFTPR